MEILEGYRERSRGDVRVLGHDPEDRDRELQERVGIVLQSCGFYPRLTVREAVEHVAKAYPAPRDPGETIALVGLEDKADARSNALSGRPAAAAGPGAGAGGRPRAGVPRRAHHRLRPRRAPRRPGAWSGALRDLGKTVLLTTHYLDEAQALADRVAIVKDGAIVAEGPPAELAPPSSGYRVSYESGGRRVEHQTDDPTDLLHRLTGDALQRGERLEGLEVARPSLEDVYLELTEDDEPMTGLALAWEQFRLERKLFWRNPSAAFFSFVLPLMLLLLVASVFAHDPDELDDRDPRRSPG